MSIWSSRRTFLKGAAASAVWLGGPAVMAAGKPAVIVVGAYLWGIDQVIRPFVRNILLGQ